VLLAVGLSIGAGIDPLDAYLRGVADAELIRHGEWWRAVTALTPHIDAPHLVANLAAGAWFGYLAGRRLGPGSAWFLAVLTTAAANGLEALFGPVPRRSVGASTAVFAVLGLLAAHAWRERPRACRRRSPAHSRSRSSRSRGRLHCGRRADDDRQIYFDSGEA